MNAATNAPRFDDDEVTVVEASSRYTEFGHADEDTEVLGWHDEDTVGEDVEEEPTSLMDADEMRAMKHSRC